MKRRAVAIALIFASAACSSANRGVAIRSVNAEAAATAQDALARGDLLFSRGEHALALDAYRRAMRKDPADAHALNGVAISYAAIGRHDLAREYFELALARAPQDERIHRNFARSLKAQGLHGEANALLAEIGQGVAPGAVRRPTLAQLAAGRAAAPAVVPARAAALGLERVSMGEVRLRTLAAATARPALPGRMTSQLSTAIVTVADAKGSGPAISLTRELKAPIVRLAAPASTARAKPIAAIGCDGVTGAQPRGMRLPEMGLSSDLSPVRDVKSSPACAAMAGGDEAGNPFKKLSKSDGSQG